MKRLCCVVSILFSVSVIILCILLFKAYLFVVEVQFKFSAVRASCSYVLISKSILLLRI